MAQLTDLDKQALKAAEDASINSYTQLSRYTIKKNWDLEPEEFAKLEFNANGYLACGIANSQILEYRPATPEREEEWEIEVYPDVGVEVDTDLWLVYQSSDGKHEWIVDSV